MSRPRGDARPARNGRKLLGSARIALVALVAAAWVGPGASVGVAAAPGARVAPKVVVVVGPAGDATPSYRRLADEAAAAAAESTTNVVKVYSPDATWTNVKAALTGASIVVYLGHGNGWPSIYRDALYPPTQDGFGLNPHAGAADTHQYFGEQQIADEIELAPNAVVILSHLCYASGNTEPGLAEGTLAEAQQRVDNYAAGFFQAGAGAVIADSYLAPASYVRAVLRGARSIESIWTGAPNRNDHFLRFASQRSKGAIAEMDPDDVDAGFHRSIVVKPNLTSAQVLRGAVRGGAGLPVLEPSLIGLGITFGAPDLAAPPIAETKTTLVLPVGSDAAARLPARLMVGTRWDRLDVDSPAATGATYPGAGADPSTGGAKAAGIDLVVPERIGEVVAPINAKRLPTGGISVPVSVPSIPGLYRLVATIHQPDGVAYDAATQALLPALVVRVTGSLTATYAAPESTTATSGRPFELAVRVTNLGRRPWGSPARLSLLGPDASEPGRRAMLVARPAVVVVRWVALASGDAAAASGVGASAILPAGLPHGASVSLTLQVIAPAAPGAYLLVIDINDPSTGSLAAAGVPPGIVRVTVAG
ncbi:MAG TPA: hypothetical protein VGJ71_08920 [Candidatus Limnocylindrales bacterium]